MAQQTMRTHVRAMQHPSLSSRRPTAPCPTLQMPIPMAKQLLGTSLAGLALVANIGAAQAGEGPTKVTEFAASGLIFKDSVEVVSLPDPDVENVLIFISEFKRSLTDKLAKDFFSEPSQASVTCAAIGPVTIKNPNVKASGGQEVFAEGKGLNLFQQKTLRVRRVYDEKHDTLLYVSYSTRLANNNDEGVSSGRYRTSICALPVAPTVVAAAVPAPVPAEVAP